MCYICSCFVYAIDFIQRLITCCVLCLLGYAVCFGLTIAIIAGIAYGYNYSLAEFLTFTRSDVTVYMRRGQFYDKPDLPLVRRRSGGGEEAVFSGNRSLDYEESGSQGQPLADTWLQSQDTRKYAEKLTKYSPARRMEKFVERPQDPVPSKPQVISIFPSPLLATVSWQSGSSEIIMRSYRPLQDISPAEDVTRTPENMFFTTEIPIKSLGFLGGQHKPKSLPESIVHSETLESNIPMRVWTTTAATRRVVPDYITEEVDEDNIVYKPV
ncbi:unnamed protein product [Arctia plantaginis]|uniref:Uncharacterized protein n=1 Tax=Arctia plantaginis TaxID=874455 RepID=A0A8S1BGG6_ARCPL|nr:unnamed protein product [Arctia plantaginis]